MTVKMATNEKQIDAHAIKNGNANGRTTGPNATTNGPASNGHNGATNGLSVAANRRNGVTNATTNGLNAAANGLTNGTAKLNESDTSHYHHKLEIWWRWVFAMTIIHTLGLYGVYLSVTRTASILTVIWGLLLVVLAKLGITVGAHRLYSHRSFKANAATRIGLIICQTIAGEFSMYTWARNHRVHHKYSDTDADPHNASRGFFFSHIGWLLCKSHPLVKEKGLQLDYSDLKSDPILMYQRKNYKVMYLLFGLVIPVLVPMCEWNETFWNAVCVCYFMRYAITINTTALINSAAHLYGTKPYDKNIMPTENWLVSLVAIGEGWHNYHHAFPWDYRAAELGFRYSFSTLIIDVLARIGFVYDLKQASDNMVVHRVHRTGDGTHHSLETTNDKHE